jgi:class 3 adenylate cyclase/tetratricopeptide (TPR) repeat protein
MMTPMAICSECGTPNADTAKFCNECGTPMSAPVLANRRERRVVSVLVADLVEFTSRSERLDVEEVDAFLAPYQRRLRREVERFGGVVCSFAGDGLMAVFGAPVAHEDDPERALRSAFAIRDSLRTSDDGLQVRIGVTSGEVLVTFGPAGEVDATGDVVNTAARLESAAPVDGILADDFTHRAADRAITFDAADPVDAKGKLAPVQAWRAIAPRSLLPEQARLGDLPLVGRRYEADALVGALGRSKGEPSAQLVTLVGPPGIGKTRLVEELWAHVESIPELITWRQGRSLAYGEAVAFWALGEMVKAEVGVLESDSAEQAAAKLRDAVAKLLLDDRDQDWVERQLRPLIGVDTNASVGGESGRVEAFAGWRRFFEALAEDGPTVLVFEDLHWADDGLLDFIDLLTDRAGGVPLLIVCTARPELFERRPTWGGGKTNSVTLSLAPLSEPDTARLVAELLDQALLPADVQRSLLAHAEGNPLYAQEYVRMLQDRGLLVREGGGWRLAGDVDDLPESVQGIIAARLDTLTAGERLLVQDAAVVGRVAWVGAVCALSDRTPVEADELVHSLERKQLLRRHRRSSVAGEVEFAFTHAVTREVAYGQISRSDRAMRHEQAAEWIHGLAGERDDKAELLAHHLTVALQLRQQVGEDPADLVPRARAALMEAAHQAEAVYSHQAAARHLQVALDLSEDDDPAQASMLLDYAAARYRAGTADEQTLVDALDAQLSAGDWRNAAWAEYILGDWVEHTLGDGDRADDHYARAGEYAARAGDPEIQSLVAHSQAARLNVTGRAAESLAFIDEMIRIPVAAGDARGRGLLLDRRGWARTALGDPGGVGDCRTASQLLAENGHPRATVAWSNYAEVLAGFGDLDGAREARDHALRLGERFGQPEYITWVRVGKAEGAYHAGDWDSALELAEAGVDDRDRLNVAWARFTRGLIALARGDVERALADAEEMSAYAASSHNAEARTMGHGLHAVAMLQAGAGESAEAAIAEFLTTWPSGGPSGRAPVLAEVAVSPARRSADADVAAGAEILPDESRFRAPIRGVCDGHDGASAVLFGEIGSRPLEAHAHLRAAQAAHAAGRHTDANDHARRALAFYGSVGAVLYGDQATALIQLSA